MKNESPEININLNSESANILSPNDDDKHHTYSKSNFKSNIKINNHLNINLSDDNESASIDINMNLLLNSVRIVMVNTTLPANIGSAARAMLTMGLTDLVVVEPKYPIDEDSVAHAAGAKEVLENCQIVENLEDAIYDCQIVFAASSRQRFIPRPIVTPLQAAQLITNHLSSLRDVASFNNASGISNAATVDEFNSFDNGNSLNSCNRLDRDNDEDGITRHSYIDSTINSSPEKDISSEKDTSPETDISSETVICLETDTGTDKKNIYPKIAILFGREDRGLTNNELALADYHIQIDANPNYPILNVASAVQVISSFLYSHFLSFTTQQQSSAKDYTDNDCNQSEVDIFIRQIWDTPAINQQQKSNLQSRIIALMADLELIESTESEKLRSLPNRLSRLISRLQLDNKEYQILSAIIAKVHNKI